MKVVTIDYSAEEARRKTAALSADPRGRRLPGEFRTYSAGGDFSVFNVTDR